MFASALCTAHGVLQYILVSDEKHAIPKEVLDSLARCEYSDIPGELRVSTTDFLFGSTHYDLSRLFFFVLLNQRVLADLSPRYCGLRNPQIQLLEWLCNEIMTTDSFRYPAPPKDRCNHDILITLSCSKKESSAIRAITLSELMRLQNAHGTGDGRTRRS